MKFCLILSRLGPKSFASWNYPSCLIFTLASSNYSLIYNSLFALATLGDATQLGSFLFVSPCPRKPRQVQVLSQYRQCLDNKLFQYMILSVSGVMHHGILKGDITVLLTSCWVWNQLYDNWHFLFLFAKQTNPNKLNRRSTVLYYYSFIIPWMHKS